VKVTFGGVLIAAEEASWEFALSFAPGAVPEPRALELVAFGLLALSMRKRAEGRSTTRNIPFSAKVGRCPKLRTDHGCHHRI
jgi:hypothetical protein